MIKCTICENHQCDGAKHTCSKCQTKTIYGEIQEPFIEFCLYYEMDATEKKRQAYFKKINSLPIDDSGRGAKKEKKKIYEIKKTAYNAEYRRAQYMKHREEILKKQKEYDDRHREEINRKARAR